eukprot:g2461.t1
MTRNAALLQRLQREDFCYREFPQSVSLHVFQLRVIVVGGLIWLVMVSLLGIIFCIAQFLADQRLSLIVAEMEHARIHKTVKEMLFLPSGVVANQVDMGIRAESMFEESDQIGLRNLLENMYTEFPTLQDVRLLFNQQDFGYYSSRNGFQADTDRCADLGDYSCLAINLKPPDLSWYRRGMLLFDPSKSKMISYCDFLSPQFIPFSELTGSPLLSQPPEATLDWHFGWARICKHEFAHLQGEAGRTFAVSKTMLSMEPFLTALEKRENFLGGRIYLIRFDLEVSSVAAMTNRIEGVRLSAGRLEAPGLVANVAEEFGDAEVMTYVLPGEYSSSGLNHVLVREVRNSNGKYLLGLVCPYYQFSDSVMLPMTITLLVMFLMPFLVAAVFQGVKYYIRKYRSGIQFQTVEEVVRMNVALATSYVPANAAERKAQARGVAASQSMSATGASDTSPGGGGGGKTKNSSFGLQGGGF